MLDFSSLSPLMKDLHTQAVTMFYILLPVFFLLAILIQWFREPRGAVDFIVLLKRSFVSVLLLVAFPEITQSILAVSGGVAERIDSVQSLDRFMAIAEMKVENYSLSPQSLLLGFNDLFLATLTFLSFLVMYVARYLTLAMFQFFWLFLVATAPLLLLFNLFEATQQVTVNLFKGLIEVACWKIVWAILGVMLASLSFGEMYKVEGSYVTVIVMNFVIAIAMIATPLIVRSLVNSGVHSASPMLAASSVAAMSAVPMRSTRIASQSKSVAKDTRDYFLGKMRRR
jgi:hypothetical protein